MNIRSNTFARALMCGAVLVVSNAACGVESSANVLSTSSPLVEGLTGTYDFVLEASDVATEFRDKCSAEASGDATRSAQCFDAIKQEASQEKIRFSRNDAGELVWTSFGVEGDREVVFVQVPVTIAQADRGAMIAKTAGWPRGTLTGQLTHFRAEMRIERDSDGLLVMIDPRKGRLAYRRAG